MRVDLRAALDQRRRRIRMWQADRDVVQALEVLAAEHARRLDLQHARLKAHAGRRHRDAVPGAQVLQRAHLRVVAQQVVGQRAQRGNGLDVLAAARSVPHREHGRHAGRDDVQRAGQQGLVHGRGARDRRPLHLDHRHTQGLGVLLDKLAVAHHVQQKVADAELLRDADAPFGAGRHCAHAQGGSGAGLEKVPSMKRGHVSWIGHRARRRRNSPSPTAAGS